MDAHSVQRIKPHSPTPSVTDTCDVATACHVAQHEPMEGLLDLRFERNQKREGKQVGVVEKPEGVENEHKKGKLEAVSDGVVEGKLTYVGEVARECQLEKEVGGNGLGFSTHTLNVNKTKHENSPQTLFSALGCNFKRYSRTRRNQRQKTVGYLKEKNLLVNTHQQQMTENDKGASPNSGHLGQKEATPVAKDI